MAEDAERGVCSGGEIYQPRVVIAGVSPLIWRRLLVPADTTIAGLHTILQTVFEWSGEHLHRFVIHGTEYGISYAGSEGFRDDARKVRLNVQDAIRSSGSHSRRMNQTTDHPPARCAHPRRVGGSP